MKERYAENNALFRDIVNLFFVVFFVLGQIRVLSVASRFSRPFVRVPAGRVARGALSKRPAAAFPFPRERLAAGAFGKVKRPRGVPVAENFARGEQVFRVSRKFTYKPTKADAVRGSSRTARCPRDGGVPARKPCIYPLSVSAGFARRERAAAKKNPCETGGAGVYVV